MRPPSIRLLLAEASTEAALRLMQKYDPSMICGLIDLLTSTEAKQTVQDELKLQAENSEDIANVRALKTSLSQIQLFVSTASRCCC